MLFLSYIVKHSIDFILKGIHNCLLYNTESRNDEDTDQVLKVETIGHPMKSQTLVRI